MELLEFLSLRRADQFWQEAISSSLLIKALTQPLGQLSSFLHSEKIGSLLKTLSFLITLALFVAIALPQFANDKEALALFPLSSLLLWLMGRFLCRDRHPVSNAADILILLYGGVNIIAAASSHYLSPSLHGLTKVIIYICSYFLLAQQLHGNSNRKFILVAVLLLTGTLVAAYGLYQYKIGVEPLATWEDPTVEDKAVRIYSTLRNPNLLAGYLVPLVPISMSLFFGALFSKRYLFAAPALFATAVIALATILTASRGGYLGLASGCATLLLFTGAYIFKEKKKLRWLIVTGLIATPLFCVLLIHFLPSVGQRFTSIFAGREHSSNSFRMNVWLSSLKMFKDNWWLGVGVGNQAFVLAYGLYMVSGYDALGTYCVPLEVAVETGVVGLAIFILMVFVALLRGHFGFWRALTEWQRWLTAGAAAAMVGMMTHGLVDTVFYRPQVQFIFWMLMAILTMSQSQPPALLAQAKRDDKV
jgi:putative inorganic carbon (hco3(-)) transporter